VVSLGANASASVLPVTPVWTFADQAGTVGSNGRQADTAAASKPPSGTGHAS